MALTAASLAVSGAAHIPHSSLKTIEPLILDLPFDARRVRILHHLGIVNRHIGKMRVAHERLGEASALAMDLHAFGLASRTYAALSNLALHDEDDVSAQLYYAQLAVETAGKAGDSFALQTALLQTLSAFMRNADAEQCHEIERQLGILQANAAVRKYVSAFRATRLAWKGRFRAAHVLLEPVWKQFVGIDKIVVGSQYALFLSLDGCRDASTDVLRETVESLDSTAPHGLFARRSVVTSWAACIVSEAANGRLARSQAMCGRAASADAVGAAALGFSEAIIRAMRRRDDSAWREGEEEVGKLFELGYGDVAATLTAAAAELERRTKREPRLMPLTPAECDVLRRLGHGLLPKEIAIETGRSVNTVRAHITNAMVKLDCHGRLEAVQAARRHGII